MRDLTDSSIDAMPADELREELKALRDAYRSMHRRAQHAVTARERSDLSRQLAKAKQTAERRADAWYFEFRRVLQTHAVAQQIFEIAAKKLGLPYGRYHSVSDLPFAKPADGRLYANVYLTPQGGVETFDIREVVERAISS